MDNIFELQDELSELIEQLKLIDSTLDKIENKTSDDEISVGSRVLIKWEDGSTIEGRVWRIVKNGIYAVNRDGYRAEIHLKKSQLQNLSVGTYGRLEKQQWLLNVKINKLKKEIFVEKNKKMTAFILSLTGGIQIKDSKKITQTDEFKTWYKKNEIERTIPLSKLIKLPEIIICSIVREFVVRTNPENTFNKLILERLLT